MFFNKIRHPDNFQFAGSLSAGGAVRFASRSDPWRLSLTDRGGDVHHLRLVPETGWVNPSQAVLAAGLDMESRHPVVWKGEALKVLSQEGEQVLLESVPGRTFGLCGDAWMLQFRHEPDMQFYGLGEHSQGWEKTGQRVKFWNNDLWAEFSLHEIRTANPNPMYVSLPWLIIKRGNTYLGLLLDHPGAVFMDLASSFVWSPENQEDRARQSFYLGAPDGGVDLYIIVGPSLPELTRKLQKWVGCTPLPPLWALGHHQCRWGYAGPRDLRELDEGFTQHEIPNDGLWLDIDYMEQYKVFTWNRALWRDDAGVKRELAGLNRRGRRVVPILDPGVKVEKGYDVMEQGLARDLFCHNPEGLPYVGFVWPGRTYYPDFSLAEVRDWWAGRVKGFASLGVAGAWLDMNDPAVGAVELEDMRFNRGAQPHAYYHNQYALGMAQASREGFLQARPNERPFLLTRSAYLSSSRYAAVWTGDNYSNWHHLRTCIPLSLGLALSGLPFNGPDVCGFGDDTTPELAAAWYKVAFLFPFFRNHSTAGTRRQEPWSLGSEALRVIGKFIRLRYRFLPYLYQLFIAQEKDGEAILRPLFYDYADTPSLPLGRIADQFMVGRDLMQAPFVSPDLKHRSVVLPGSHAWYDAQSGAWLEGGRVWECRFQRLGTPLFVREGALVPMQKTPKTASHSTLAAIELHVFLRLNTRGTHHGEYSADDGHTFDYQAGARTTVRWSAKVEASELHVEISSVTDAYRKLRFKICAYDKFKSVRLVREGRARRIPLQRSVRELSGGKLAVWVST